ncbi:MAG: hypothetical protein Crog4KO_14380 [Crocinitomicaceae bacterium]
MKRYYYTFLLAFIFTSCQQEAPSIEKEKSSEAPKEPTEFAQTTPTKKMEDLGVYDYFAGTIGLYGEDVLMEINQEELELTGRYWYLKHGKQIALEGVASAKSGEWQLKESVKNVVTGNMTLQWKDGKLTGQWYAPGRKSELQEVALEKVFTSENGPIQPNFETYKNTKTITIYNGETDEEQEASDDIRLVRIGDHVLFQYFVIGTNAHVGHINGLAKMQGKNKAVFSGEEGCQLSLNFENNAVTILEDEDCSYYRGMRAYFEGTLKKVN